jgi:serine/threonine protein kinase
VSPELSAVVTAIGRIAQTLASLAAGGVAHRDIKPDNLFQLNGEWVIGDFGLVKYPEQEQVTQQGQPLGPYYFMAPEMRRDADTTDGELADVYSKRP